MNNVFQNFAQATVAPGVRQRTADDYQQTVQSPQPTANIQQQQSGVQQPTTQDLLGNGKARITVPQNQSTGVAESTKAQGGVSWLIWVIVVVVVVALIAGAVRLLRTQSQSVQTDDEPQPKDATDSIPVQELVEESTVDSVKEKLAETQAGSVKKKRKSKSKRKKR